MNLDCGLGGLVGEGKGREGKVTSCCLVLYHP